MAVRFRSTQPHPAIDEDEVFATGDFVVDVMVQTADLPRGFPVSAFAPCLTQGGYAIRVDVTVERAQLLLRPSIQRNQPDIPEYRLSFMVFATAGLPAIGPFYVEKRGFVDRPGRLYPLPAERDSRHTHR